MSVLMVLKYPLSIPPRPGELEALPEGMYLDFVCQMFKTWGIPSSELPIVAGPRQEGRYRAITRIYDHYTGPATLELKKLKQTIFNLDEV